MVGRHRCHIKLHRLVSRTAAGLADVPQASPAAADAAKQWTGRGAIMKGIIAATAIGPAWLGIVIPVIVFAVAFWATWRLYKHFAGS